MRFFIGLIPCMFLFCQLQAQNIETRHPTSKNWIAIYIWDSFAPLTLDQTVPEMLVSLEVIFQQHATYSTKGKTHKTYGGRSTEGHFMVWIHVDDKLYEAYGLERSVVPEKAYLFKDRETDIFTAWSGQANFRDFIRDGVSGLCNKTIFEDGSVSGELDIFSNAVNMGDAEYAAGFYLTDEQAVNAIKAIMQYPGFEKGYGFIAKEANRPEQKGYEHPEAQAVNGYNCNDFAFYMLQNAGVMSQQACEDLKVEFWYPTKYWDHTIPLKGSGKRIFKKFDANRNLYMSREKILALAWTELLFSGLDIFDEAALKKEIEGENPSFNKIRVWDQQGMIQFLKNPANRDFRAKLVLEELKVVVENNAIITTPYTIKNQQFNYRTSKSFERYQQGSQKRTAKKLKQIGLWGSAKTTYTALEKALKSQLDATN